MFEWLRGRGRGRAATPTYGDPFEGLTEGALRVVALAREESRHLGHSYIGTEHVLLGLLREDEGTAATVLKGSGMDLDGARGSVEGIVGQDDGTPGPGEVPFTPRAKGVLRLARLEALRLDHDHVSAEYLLLGLVRDAEEGGGLGRGGAGPRGPGRGSPRGAAEGFESCFLARSAASFRRWSWRRS